MREKQGVGLREDEAREKLRQYGENRLANDKRMHPLKIFAGQFKDFMTLILLASTALSLFMGESFEAVTIIAIVLLNAILGFLQEYRTEKTLLALKNFAPQTSRVIRDGEVKIIESAFLVPEDVLLAEAGDRIPADGVIIGQNGFGCDESVLTGESTAVDKIEGDEVYMGAVALRGNAQIRITQTGMNTKMGHIAGMLTQIEPEPTPLQKKLDKLGKVIGFGCLGICAVVMICGILRGENAMDMLITGISLAVAAVPEGLSAIVTICLALAVNRILKRHALIKKLHAVETLGCIDVICSDKTGTLTENRMTVQELVTWNHAVSVSGNGYEKRGSFTDQDGAACYPTEDADLGMLLKVAVLCNHAQLKSQPGDFQSRNRRVNTMEGSFELIGEPTENALLVLAAKTMKDPNEWRKETPILHEIPFDSQRKCMSVAVREHDGMYIYTKGAFDVIVEHCTHYRENGSVYPLTPAKKQRFKEENDRLASQAMRVIGFAYRPIAQFSEEIAETSLILVGLCGMIDPPRKEAFSAVAKCRRAGIRPVMITGDHKLTAKAIAEQLRIYHDGDRILTGSELERLTDEQLDQVIDDTSVFARVSPKDKLRIVRALKRRNHIVAMTGDGVNDAPAIKEADIGVAMGINGTDVTKETASVVLLDDNFATIVAAVEEGRTIYGNIRKFIRYLLSCNIGEVITMFVGMLMGLPVVLLPMHILLINLVTDSLPALALGVEPPDRNAMNLRPRRKEEGIFSDGLAGKIIFRGILIGLTTLAVYVGFLKHGEPLSVARTAAFVTLVATQLIHVFECKSEKLPLYRINPFNNVLLIFAVLISSGVVALSLYLPWMRLIFQTEALTISQLTAVFGASLIVPILSGIFMKVKK